MTPELARFWPPLLLVLVDHPDRNPASQTMRISPSLEDVRIDELVVPVRTLLTEVFRYKLLSDVRLDVRPPLAPCPQSDCPYHSTRLCDGWLPLPKRPQDCQFPDFLRAATRHDLDSTGDHLVPLPERQTP